MVEMPGSEFQIREIVFLVNLDYGDVYYRKTKDSNGDDYFLILNSTGEEVAEWRMLKNGFCYRAPVRQEIRRTALILLTWRLV